MLYNADARTAPQRGLGKTPVKIENAGQISGDNSIKTADYTSCRH
jgi:hypothetical protein